MTFWLWFAGLVGVLGIISALHAVMTARTSQGAIAWGISLVTFPVVTVPAYWVLGRNKFAGYVTAKRMVGSDFERDSEVLDERLATYRIPKTELSDGAHVAEKLADIPFLTGNAVELLIDGDATFKSIIAGIEQAEQYVLFQFYIINDDDLGRRCKDLLVNKTKEGVAVHILYDEIGSQNLTQGFIHELRHAGAEINAFNTRKGPGNRFQINFRNHRKVVVVDGKEAWIGGHNVGDEYLGRDPKFGHWRDTHMRMAGPAALSAQLSFCADWHWATNDFMRHLNWHPTPAESENIPIIILPSGPADDVEIASLMFLHAINSAKKRVWIQSPYFVPDDALISALQLAALRGVDVRVLIPDEIDHLLVWLCAFSYHKDATMTGAKIYRYTHGFLHAKTILIDDSMSAIGTANLDNRSLRLNFEITAWMYDVEFAQRMETMYLTDFENARLMTAEDLSERPWWFKLAVQFARLTAPIQ